jgi:hypothetical protein
MARTHSKLAAVTAVSVLAMLAGAGCSMQDTPIPALSGPSTFGQNLYVTITPDVLPQDGQSTARVVVQVTNESGQGVPNFPLRLDMFVPADSHNPSSPLVMMDVGQLSTKFPTTGSSGQVQVTYTAPLGAENGNTQRDEIYVTITATPVGSDNSAALPRSARIRLVPLGTIIE